MKKIKLNTAKLQLKKEKITSLSSEQLSQIQGGASTNYICPQTQQPGCMATKDPAQCVFNQPITSNGTIEQQKQTLPPCYSDSCVAICRIPIAPF